MKKFTTILCAMLLVAAGAFAKSEKQTVVFDVDLHCQGCITKVEKNIAFEKGVKDLQCSLEEKTVTVTFDPAKTNVAALQAAFEKIGKPATIHGQKCCNKPCQHQCQHGNAQQPCQHQCQHEHK